MDVRFWGVRGSVAVSGARFARTGGNTSCVEVVHEGARIILDGGTGLSALGDQLGFVPVSAMLLFSHVHWDHIQGVPFFSPAFHPESRLLLGSAPLSSGSLRDALSAQMRPPSFPIGLDALRADLRFCELGAGQTWEHGPFRITGARQNHPQGSTAWRIEAGGRAMVYATDVEHGAGALDPTLLALAEGADLLIHDAQYTRAEYTGQSGPSRRGWGHSTWEEAVGFARDAACRALALFHHDPRRDDDTLAVIEAQARDWLPGSFVAREGALVAL